MNSIFENLNVEIVNILEDIFNTVEEMKSKIQWNKNLISWNYGELVMFKEKNLHKMSIENGTQQTRKEREHDRVDQRNIECGQE